MKKNINKIKTIKKTLQKFLTMIFILAIINQLAACSYYKIESIGWKNKEQTKNQMLDYKVNNKYIIVDCGKESYHVTDMVIDTILMTINCCISPVDSLQKQFIHDKKSNHRYYDEEVLNEVHIITNKFYSSQDSSAIIPINSIVRIDIISPDTGRIVESYVSIIGCILLIPIIIAVIGIATWRLGSFDLPLGSFGI
jgi:hypothetical protein